MSAWRIFYGGATMLMAIGIALTFLGDKGHLVKWFALNRTPLADLYFYHVTKLGEEYGFVVIGLILWLRSWRRMIAIPVLGLLVTLMSYALKKYFHLERPSLYLRRIGWEGPMGVLDYQVLSGYASFPSGHSLAAWALFTLTAAMIRKTWVSILCLFLAASVAISRVYLMAHFLRDVIGGAAIGFVMGYAIYWAYDKWLINNKIESSLGADNP
jgi:membrane-associated phospholipid phosphatase